MTQDLQVCAPTGRHPKLETDTLPDTAHVNMRSQDEANNTFLEKASEISAAFQKLERDAKELWQIIDECTPSLVICEIQETDEAFESNRKIQRSVEDVFGSLQPFLQSWTTRTLALNRTLNEFRFHIDRTANKRALDRLPAELLRKILIYTPTNLKTALTISHVCRQFRAIVIGAREIWSQICLSSKWSIEQNLTIAERSGFRSSRAYISLDSFGQDSLQLLESAKAILGASAHLEELEVVGLTTDSAKELQRYLEGSRMKALHYLIVFQADRVSSLQFPGFCEIPSLRFLEADIAPHVSLAENLVECHIRFPFWVTSSLRDWMEFLSFAHHLQDLELKFCSSSIASGYLEPISLPKLRSLTVNVETFSCFPVIRSLMDNIVPFAVGKLTLIVVSLAADMRTVGVNEFFSFIQHSPSIRELELRLHTCADACLDVDFGYIPKHVEVLSLKYHVGVLVSSWAANPGAFNARQLRRIRFTRCYEVTHSSIFSLRNFFMRTGHYSISFLFRDCKNFQDGTYGLDDVESAFVGNEA